MRDLGFGLQEARSTPEAFGSWFIRGIANDNHADAEGRTLRLSVLRGSEANSFYLRHGYRETRTDDFDVYYERTPAREFGDRLSHSPSRCPFQQASPRPRRRTGSPHHVTARGNRREPNFFDQDRAG